VPDTAWLVGFTILAENPPKVATAVSERAAVAMTAAPNPNHFFGHTFNMDPLSPFFL